MRRPDEERLQEEVERDAALIERMQLSSHFTEETKQELVHRYLSRVGPVREARAAPRVPDVVRKTV
jgi:hypothetical protein